MIEARRGRPQRAACLAKRPSSPVAVVDLHLLEHLDGFARVLQRNVGRRRHHDRAGKRNGLDQGDGDVACSGRQIDDEVSGCGPWGACACEWDMGTFEYIG